MYFSTLNNLLINYFDSINILTHKCSLRSTFFQPDYPAIRKTCNMWRNYNDINDSWESINSIIAFWAQNLYNMSAYAGPGGWNDPDEVGIIQNIQDYWYDPIQLVAAL